MPPPFFTGRPAVVVQLIFAPLTFFFLIFLSHHHFPSPSPSSPHISRRSALPPLEGLQATVTSRSNRSTTVFVTDSVTVTLESSPSSLSASSSRLFSSSVSLSTSVSHSSNPAPFSSSLSVGSSSLSSSRTTIARSTSKKAIPSSTFIPAPTTSDTLILVPTTLSVPSITFSLTDNIASPTTLVVINTATSSDQAVPSLPPSAPVQASNSGTGFWSNKGAVGGTFTVVALASLVAVVFLIAIFLKRVRRNRARKLDEELYGNLFEANQSRSPSPSDARSLTYSAIDPFAAGEVVQIRNGGASLPTVNGMSNAPSAFKNTGYGDSDDGHSSNDHSSSNHHGFSSISYRTGVPDSRGGFTQPGPSFYEPPSVTLQTHSQSYNKFYNSAALPQSTSTVPQAYGNPNVGPGTYNIGQVHPYYHGASATGPPGGPAGRAL